MLNDVKKRNSNVFNEKIKMTVTVAVKYWSSLTERKTNRKKRTKGCAI